ncbi:MAG: sulfurtransferase complex subunit TusD [Pseudomonadota bacterium]
MQFTIAVHGSPYQSSSNEHALGFCRAALAAGHQIVRVFFYHDGVYTALASRQVPQDEANTTAAWQALANDADVELCVCIANALKRGVVDNGEADRHNLPQPSLAAGFEIVGLGQLVDAMLQADRYIEFPA